MEDASGRRKRLKMMRDEADDAPDTDVGGAVLANPLTDQEDCTPVPKTFSFYSDPLGSLQSAALKTPVMHQRAVGQSQTDPSERSKPHQTLTAALPPHKPPSVPPHQDGLGVPAPQAPPFPYQQPVMRPAFHQEWHQHIQAPPFLHPGRGNSQQQSTGQARGRGRGRGASGSDSIEAYVSPAMLQDPWAKLMQQHLHHMADSEPVPANAPEHNSSLNGQPGQSLADVFAAAEMEAQAIDQGNLSEEGIQDRPWH
ncbi:hypothetical protein WJX79_008012 [Trebouxia sp. C0005]